MAGRGNPNWKGKGGNPNGRPKGYADFAKRCRELADSEGFGTLRELAKSSDPRIRLDATRYIIDRGYGKATERVEVKTNEYIDFTDEQLAQIAAGKAKPTDFIK